LLVLFVACLTIAPDLLSGQNPQQTRAQPEESPEQMIQEALEKIDQGEFEAAAALAQRAKRLKPTLSKLNLVDGLLYMNLQSPRYPEAVQRLQEYNISEEGRNDFRGFAALGAIYRESRLYRQAIRPLEQAKKLAPLEENGRPVRAEITLDLAFAYAALDRKKEALETAKEAESMAPNEAKIQAGFARLAVQVEEFGLAEPAVKRAIELLKAKIQGEPLNDDAPKALQGCYELLNRIKRNDLKVSPDDGGPYSALANIGRERAEADRRIGLLLARRYALVAIEKEPKKVEHQILAAQIEADLGAYQEARRRLEEVLQSNAGNPAAAKLLEGLPPTRSLTSRPS
jgi:tetratricopeptide (TPR) repeat protein